MIAILKEKPELGDAQRQTEHAERDAGERNGQLLVDLDPRPVAVGPVRIVRAARQHPFLFDQLAQTQLPERARHRRGVEVRVGAREQNPLRLVDRSIVLIGFPRIPEVRLGTRQVQPDVLLRLDDGEIAALRDDDPLARAARRERRHAFVGRRRCGRFRRHLPRRGEIAGLVAARVGDEYALPLAGGRIDVVHVDHDVVVLVEEDARLDRFLDRGGHDLGPKGDELLVAPRQHVVHQVEVDQEDGRAEEKNRPVDRARGDAERSHGHDLRVGRKPPDRDQDSEQERHRHGQHDDVRQRVDQELSDHAAGKRAADDHAGQLEQLPHDDDRRVEEKPEKGRANHLLEDVTREDAQAHAAGIMTRDAPAGGRFEAFRRVG
jgi:hypothetical protein